MRDEIWITKRIDDGRVEGGNGPQTISSFQLGYFVEVCAIDEFGMVISEVFAQACAMALDSLDIP